VQIQDAIGTAQRLGLVGPVVEQPQYNLFERTKMESEYLHIFRNYGYGTTIWSPLASGILTGKYNSGIPDDSRLSLPKFRWLRRMLTENPDFPRRIEAVKQLAPIAAELKCSLPQMAIAWTLKNPNTSTCLLGASRVEQLQVRCFRRCCRSTAFWGDEISTPHTSTQENLKALEVVPRLTADVMKRIEEVVKSAPTVAVNPREMMRLIKSS